MSLHKNAKIAKIIEEVYDYFLDRGYKKISVSLNISDLEQTIIQVQVSTSRHEIVSHFKEDMICCRNTELEEYCWELMGESAETCKLDTLSSLIDKYDIEYSNNTCFITLYRNEI